MSRAFLASRGRQAAGDGLSSDVEALLKAVLGAAVKAGALTVVTARGRPLEFGDGTGAPVRIRFADARAERELALNPALKLGELFTDGRLIMEQGSVYDLLMLMLADLRDLRPPLAFRLWDEGRRQLWLRFPQNAAGRSRRNVAHHYDIGDSLYALFLDPDWQYSCAYFETSEQDLAGAQRAKVRHIAAKLRIEPHHSVLDIGSGWGGLALYLAGVADAREVLGVTLSQEQLTRAQGRARAAGLEGRVRFALQDYRAVQGRFDRIVSVGMFEHVGLGFYDVFFRSARRLLAEDGVMLLHTIGSTGTPGPTNPWVVKHVFPGGHIPSLSDIIASVERSGLVVTDVETLGPHYARTLRAWRTGFMARRDEAAALFDERFCRLWEFYLALSEAAFRTDDVTLYQVQLARRREDVPLTRGYIGAAEGELRGREGPPVTDRRD